MALAGTAQIACGAYTWLSLEASATGVERPGDSVPSDDEVFSGCPGAAGRGRGNPVQTAARLGARAWHLAPPGAVPMQDEGLAFAGVSHCPGLVGRQCRGAVVRGPITRHRARAPSPPTAFPQQDQQPTLVAASNGPGTADARSHMGVR